MKPILFVSVAVAVMCSLASADESQLSVKNPTTKAVLVTVIGTPPLFRQGKNDAVVEAGGYQLFTLKQGIYRLRVRFGDAANQTCLESPLFTMTDATYGSQPVFHMTLPDPKQPISGWHPIKEPAFEARNTTNALDATDSVGTLIQVVTIPPKAVISSNAGNAFPGILGDRIHLHMEIEGAVDHIEGTAARSRAIQELGRLADANATARDATQREVMQNALSALGCFKDRPGEVKPILNRYTSHADTSIAETAKRKLEQMRNSQEK